MEKLKVRSFRKSLRKLERITISQVKENICCQGVTMAQCHVLMEVGEYGQITTNQIAKNFSLNKSTISRTIDGLVNLGYVERKPHPTDRRHTLLLLSKRGEKIYQEFNKENDEFYGKVLQNIPEKKLNKVLEHFVLLVQIMTDYYQDSDSDECSCS